MQAFKADDGGALAVATGEPLTDTDSSAFTKSAGTLEILQGAPKLRLSGPPSLEPSAPLTQQFLLMLQGDKGEQDVVEAAPRKEKDDEDDEEPLGWSWAWGCCSCERHCRGMQVVSIAMPMAVTQARDPKLPHPPDEALCVSVRRPKAYPSRFMRIPWMSD
jgi:hypothetical protein